MRRYPVQRQRIQIVLLLISAIALLRLVFLAAKVTHGETIGFDETIRNAIHSISTPALTQFFSAITYLGSQACVLSLSACAAIILLAKRQSRRAFLIVVTMAGAELWLSILKAAFHRQRPEPFFGAHLPPSYSFPSGHALLSCCCYAVLAALFTAYGQARVRWFIRLCAALLILAIGISRIYLGVHYPSDVIAGYLVAVVWMASLLLIHDIARRDHNQ
jgi:undecaprenyl-diphosphatase